MLQITRKAIIVFNNIPTREDFWRQISQIPYKHLISFNFPCKIHSPHFRFIPHSFLKNLDPKVLQNSSKYSNPLPSNYGKFLLCVCVNHFDKKLLIDLTKIYTHRLSKIKHPESMFNHDFIESMFNHDDHFIF